MEADIAEGMIGEVAAYDLEFKGGKLVAKLKAEVSFGSAGVEVSLDAGAVMDALAKAIPGTIDDAIIGVAKGALLGK